MSSTAEGCTNEAKLKRGLTLLEDIPNQAEANGCKVKNHPSFTIIVRKQLPACFDLVRLVLGQPQDEKGARNEAQELVSSARLPPKQDFVLVHSWQLWVLGDNQANDWNVKLHGSPASTARHFWTAYSQVYDMLEGRGLKNLMIFQEGIEPKWEDAANKGGGRWYFDVSYNGRGEAGRRDSLLRTNYWTDTLQSVLSGTLDSSAHLVTGLILNFKPSKYRVSLWTRSCADFSPILSLGASLRRMLNLRCQLKFELHSASPSSTVLEL